MRKLLAVPFLAIAMLFAAPAAPASANHGTFACEQAIRRNRAPLANGAREFCSSPVYSWGATDGVNIYYNPHKIARSGNSNGLWNYVVSHERGHAMRYANGQNWRSERGADLFAHHFYGASCHRWSPYQKCHG